MENLQKGLGQGGEFSFNKFVTQKNSQVCKLLNISLNFR